MNDRDPRFRSSNETENPPPATTRREFLKYSMGATAAFTALGGWIGFPSGSQVIILENAEGLLVTDTTRCVGCRRCELACTEYHEGRAHPTLARIKVSRNHNFGPRGQRYGTTRSLGEFGNFRLVQDTCLQCPHPVPCATACPHDAIVADAKTKARVVDPEKCEGCRVCQRACPWEMTVFDEATQKASKCFLCDGRPECVEACPAMALRYVPWRDLSRAIPVRQAVLSFSRTTEAVGCSPCH